MQNLLLNFISRIGHSLKKFGGELNLPVWWYRIAKNFRGVKLSWMDLQLMFRDLIFED